MINLEDFSKRLQNIIDFHSLSASAFAERIGVQRSSISHILSGRNKPSLDFVLKIIQEFPDVELQWLLKGKGDFPSIPNPSESQKEKQPTIRNNQTQKKPSYSNTSPDKAIERIIIFYEDGSFKNFIN